jgi:predicted nucleic acid-binding protein
VPGLVAVVLAGRGGVPLARALDSVAWAGERIVLDPTARLSNERLPADVRRLGPEASVTRAATAPWLLLLHEDEVVSPELAAAIAGAVDAPVADAYRLPLEVRGFGARLELRRAPIRLAKRAGARLSLSACVHAELEVGAARAGRLGPRLLLGDPVSIADAVEQIDADAAVHAALLYARAAVPRFLRLLLAPLTAAGRVLTAHATARAPWARWSLAVLAGYRALVAHAKLWELGEVRGPARR